MMASTGKILVINGAVGYNLSDSFIIPFMCKSLIIALDLTPEIFSAISF